MVPRQVHRCHVHALHPGKGLQRVCTHTPHIPPSLGWTNLLIFNISLTDSLGHDQQDWLCCECLQADECLGRDLGERCLPGLQLLPQVRQSSWAPSSPPKTGSLLNQLRIWGRDFRQSRLVVVALNFFFRQQQKKGWFKTTENCLEN